MEENTAGVCLSSIPAEAWIHLAASRSSALGTKYLGMDPGFRRYDECKSGKGEAMGG
jgi:hypothetical protein